MIVGLRGSVVEKERTFLHLDVHGVIYELLISLNTAHLIEKGDTITIHTTLISREDGQTLYGFLEREEKRLFDRLIKINGVGPKVALAICSTFTPQEFGEIVGRKDLKMLKKVPGVGSKSAQRILLELEDFKPLTSGMEGPLTEAMQALEALGFPQERIREVLSRCESRGRDTASLVKEALRKIQQI
ncbi:MAG: Holliday junction branch migration protein RuvA [Epsilonproteobacteria bacterium]|nr:Holliday junction branch migration protein RuvA [Campylobacterota bacterium]NPA56607.1 Holliday junction branch migration protein RuvA [Campylobacterota bacterium]